MMFFLQSSLDLQVIKNYLDLKQEFFQYFGFPPSKACSVPSGLPHSLRGPSVSSSVHTGRTHEKQP